MKNLKSKKGITLIALVITIIVLLILAGVSITMISGDDGIITRASDAKEKTEEKSREEMEKLGTVDDYIDSKINETVTSENNGNAEDVTGDNQAKTITFTIHDVSYTAEEGMTFEKWINSSEYDSDDFYVSSTDGWVCNSYGSLSAVLGYGSGTIECIGTLEIVDGSVFVLEPNDVSPEIPDFDGSGDARRYGINL